MTHSACATKALFVVALTLAAAAPAAASPFDLAATGEVKVSQASTLTGCPFGASPDFATAYDDAEVESQVAVNPTDSDEIAGAFQQDRWPDGGARGLTAALSSDGGTSWALSTGVPWAACQDGPLRFGRVTDPWVSYDKAGNLYWIGQPIDSAELGISAISVTTLDRGTGGWATPRLLIEDVGTRFVFNDKVSITGDPTRSGYAYATWLRGDYPPGQKQGENADFHSFAYRGQPMIARTADGGQSWTGATAMRESNAYFQGNQIAVLPDGTLLNVTAVLFTGAGIQPNNKGVYMGVMRSGDAGAHWSAPAKIAPIRTTGLFNPDDPSEPVRAEDYLPDIAVDDETGDAYVVWADGLGGAINQVVMSKSSDGGRHWTAPRVVSTGGPAVQSFNHAIDVTDDGTVVLTYYDFRNNVAGDGVLTTDVWLRHSHDGGATWGPEQHLHGPFDMREAPVSAGRGFFLGDYEGLETIAGDDAIAFFTSTIDDGADVISRRLEHP